MKKRIVCVILMLFLVNYMIVLSEGSINKNSSNIKMENIIKKVNDEYKIEYGINFDFYNGNYEVSERIYEKYNILVCSIEGVTEHGNQDKNGEYRYLGYDPYGESIENPNYYYDALDGTNFEEFNWILTPYLNASVIQEFAIDRSHFDHFAPQFRDIFIYGFNYYHGENGIFGNHLGENWQDLPWEEYYHIPIAPTETTRGVAWLFHKEKDGSIWYTSAWLPPLSVLNLEESEIVNIEGVAGNAVLAHNQVGLSTYDVKQSVPTNEPLYINITVDEYLLNLSVNKVSGIHSYEKEVYVGDDRYGNPQYTYVTAYVPYHFYKIDHLEVYGLDHTITDNYALPDGSVTLYPDSQYFKHPQVEFNQNGGVIAIEDNVTVWNDKLEINGQVILSDARVSQYAPEPKDVIIPATHNRALYKEGLIIPKELLNKASSNSNTYAYYTYIDGTGGTQEKVRNVLTNSVTIHTPVVCNGGILSDNAFDQSIQLDNTRASVILGRPTKIQILTQGQHKEIVGYGNKEYAKYTKAKQVKIPFDVYIDTSAPTKEKFLKANTWYSIPIEQEIIELYVPTWVNEGPYTIEYRTLAINAENHSASEALANLNLNHYIATDSSEVKVIGRLYGFKITDVENYPLWETVFRTNENSFNHSNHYYRVGLNNEDGMMSYSNRLYTLPLLNGSHPTVKNEGTIPLGYTFKFECETIGNYYSEKDCIEIHPSFYFVSKDGASKKAVDIWYSEYFNDKNNNFIKVGSPEDKMNVKYIEIGDVDRNVSVEEIKDTSTILGVTEKAFKDKKAKLGWYDRIILAEPLRTFVGKTDQLPQEININHAKQSIQHWYGEYYLPSQLYVATKGTDVLDYARTNNGLNGKESFWLKEGYLVVNFDITTIKNGDFDNPVLSYYNGARCNMWQVEGYNQQKVDYNGYTFNLDNGDIVFYDLNRHSVDDFNVKGTH